MLSGGEVDAEIYPVRVINVGDTVALARGVCFSTPKDWNFHVISHTWSMKVRDWSQEVASRIGGRTAAAATSAGHGYNEEFQKEDFSKRPYYDDFLEFLQILQADGVERAWFDALCINQNDMEEKSREIMQMGNFYSKSVGCYVIAHGLGQGFAPLSRDGSLPRWFWRVWTMQELLLPKELWFIVELDEDTLRMVDFRPHEQHRKVPVQIASAGNGSSHLYFLDSHSYDSLLGWQVIRPESNQEVIQHLLTFWEFSALRSVILDQPGKMELYTCRITKEVEYRDCSEGHDEDRLLSILALIGVDSRKMNQLRVGKSLEEQILDLLSQLVKTDQRLLLALCASSMRPYTRPGMSWFPNLMRSSDAQLSNSPFLVALPDTTEVTDVSETGLKLACRFLRAQCLSFEVHKTRCVDPLHCMSCTVNATLDDAKLQWVFHIEDVGEAGGGARRRPVTFPALHFVDNGRLVLYFNPFPSTRNNPRLVSGLSEGQAVETSGLVLKLCKSALANDPAYTFLPPFYSWLLLIGHHISYEDHEDPSRFTSSFLFMVCVGTSPHRLHKVGTIQVKERNFGPGWELLHSWYNNDTQSHVSAFTVGGFGDEISLSDLQIGL